MGTGPLSDWRRVDIEKRLKEAKERQALNSRYVADLEGQLKDGTAWCLDPEENRRGWEWSAELARKSRERSEQREIEQYGQILTDGQRKGWTELPEEVKR